MSADDTEDAEKLRETQLWYICICMFGLYFGISMIFGTWDFAMQGVSGPRTLGWAKSCINLTCAAIIYPLGKKSDKDGPQTRFSTMMTLMVFGAVGVAVIAVSDGNLLGLCIGGLFVNLGLLAEEILKTSVADR